MRAPLVAALMLMLTACATTSGEVTSDDYSLDITTNDAEQRFDVALQSLSSKPLCVSVDSWPNSLGELHYASDYVAAVVGDNRYAIRDQNFGYCLGSRCSHRIEPGQRLVGFVSYSAFPEAPLQGAAPVLIFPVPVHSCARGEGI